MIQFKKHFSLVFAVIFAGLSSISISYYLENREKVLIAKTEPVSPVVVAARDLPMGMKITENDLKTERWPSEIVTDRFFKHPRQLVGRTLHSGVIASEPITTAKLMKEGDNLAKLIPNGMRAVPVTIRRSNTLARVLEPGSIVDVVAIMEDKAPMKTRVIAQAVSVLAIDNSGLPDLKNTKDGSDSMEVMLLVTPRDADWIVYARNQGLIDLVLRNEASETADITDAGIN